MTPPKRRKLSHGAPAAVRPAAVNATPISYSPSPSLVRGLQDLHQNGGLQLFIDALTIYRRIEQREGENSAMRLVHGNGSHDRYRSESGPIVLSQLFQ